MWSSYPPLPYESCGGKELEEQFPGLAFEEEKAFCFELLNSIDFMLQIFLSYNLPWLLEVTFGKKEVEEALWNIFNMCVQPTGQEMLVWWSQLLAGRQAFQLLFATLALTHVACHWPSHFGPTLQELCPGWCVPDPFSDLVATHAISGSQTYNTPSKTSQNQGLLPKELCSHLSLLKAPRLLPFHHQCLWDLWVKGPFWTIACSH